MAPELPGLGVHNVIVGLPDLDADELLPACEVLCQEGFKVWTLSAGQTSQLPGLLRVYRRRARIGVHGVTTAAQVQSAAGAGASFVASDFLLPELVGVVPELPVVLGGMTPSELRAGMEAGAAAVQLVPSEAFGTSYLRILPSLLAPGPVIQAGRVERYQAELWLDAGGLAVFPRDIIGPEAVLGDNLDDLRVTLQHWRLGD
ncbi:bifunctional 4-hydroxy-2-oxoglutarate aldolase/2-dehydro-3-deoxy-phosphogluconate aldolase [Propionicimonas sp.]|uniref:bifunctional 4-hydroxy-2-oxoglutarate aldolase/2-dehydro-3-deoxy-phosphogluconate aldolase n=1 Tax=Propionicimonas sp. TaxID=1955623 RepID=UPI0039E72037